MTKPTEEQIEYGRELIETILEWTITNPKRSFDLSFVDTCREQLERKSFLSSKQIRQLEKIVDQFHIKQ